MKEVFRIAGLGDIEELEKVPATERVKEKSTYELLEKGAGINPEAPAISFLMNGDAYKQPQQIPYKEFIAKIRQTANMLSDLGVTSNDVVTYILPNLPQTHYVLWGAEAVGIANPINPMLEPATIKDICMAAGTKVLVTLGEFPGTDIWQKVNAIRKDIPSLQHIIRVMAPSDEAEGILGFEEKVEQYPKDKLIFDRVVNPDDIASLYHTGGTTGRPKLARRTHYNECVVAWDLAVGTELRPGESIMMGLPLFHCNGTIVTGLMPFSIGGHVVMLSPMGYRDPSIMKNFYKIVDHYKPVFFSAVPTVLGVLLDIPVGDSDISSLRFALCGAAPLSVELFHRFEKTIGMKILEGYGLTETAVASSVNPKDGERKIGSIGIRLPYHWIKIAIVDDEGNYVRDASTNEIGVVAIKGPCVFKGYVEDIHNKGIWLGGGWFNTGDLGRQDEDGYLWLTGRKKELIIRGGHNIDPAIIEEALYKMPHIKVAAAVGRPDAHAGEVPVAFVELSEGASVSADKILEFAREHIGERAAIPKDVYIVDEMPLTTVGKIFKPALRFDATKKIYEQELSALGQMAESIQVSVGEDKVHGTLVSIHIKPAADTDQEALRERVADLLSKYTIKYELGLKAVRQGKPY